MTRNLAETPSKGESHKEQYDGGAASKRYRRSNIAAYRPNVNFSPSRHERKVSPTDEAFERASWQFHGALDNALAELVAEPA